MDAHCGLCARGAKWIALNDRKGEFGIIPVQSETGRALLEYYGLDPDDPTTWLMVEEGVAYSDAVAVFRTAARLGGKWRFLGIFRIIPHGIMQRVYHVIARNRYRISRAKDWCDRPHLEVKRRLLDNPS